MDGVSERLVRVPRPHSKPALQNALDGARYAFHRVTRQKYAHAVLRMEMTPEQAEQMYRAAMNNYDDIVTACARGVFAEANARQMAADLATPYAYAESADAA